MSSRLRRPVALLALAVLAATACGGDSDAGEQPLVIGGIPDQEVAILEERFNGLADYLADELDLPVEYQPATDYAAIVTAFSNADIALGWFGGLTGVQARAETPGAEAIAQREIDTEFRSVYIVGADVEAESLDDLRGLSFTFGSESSTSGHLMPRFFLHEAGVDPDEDFAQVSYSGSHDRTWSLVEAGSFDAGAMSQSVWERITADGEVDEDQVRLLEPTPEFVNYHWVANPAIDERYGEGTIERIAEVLVTMDDDDDPRAQEILDLFEDDRFIPTDNGNYEPIEQTARQIGLIE